MLVWFLALRVGTQETVKNSFTNLKISLLLLVMRICVQVCAHEFRYLERSEEGILFPGVEIDTGSHELPITGVGCP